MPCFQTHTSEAKPLTWAGLCASETALIKAPDPLPPLSPWQPPSGPWEGFEEDVGPPASTHCPVLSHFLACSCPEH